MGLVYTKFYMDFDPEEWRQVSNDPVTFEASKDGTSLEVEDASHKTYRLKFQKGGRVHMLRVTGRYRITWDDKDIATR